MPIEEMMEDLISFYEGRISFDGNDSADDIMAFWLTRYRQDPDFRRHVASTMLWWERPCRLSREEV